MLKKVLYKLNNSVGGGAILIALFSIISKLLGLLRDRLLAVMFGASRITDIYFAAFRLPDFIFNILVLGALMSSFIPIFQRVWRANEKQGIKLSNSILNILLLFIILCSIILFFIAPIIMNYMVPGFSSEEIYTTVMMTRILLLSVFLFTISNIIGGILNSWKKFLTFSLGPVLYNSGIILGILFFYPIFGMAGLAWGVVLGAFMHFAIQFIEVSYYGWRYRFYVFIDDAVKRVFTLMIPRTIGLAANQINIIITTILASFLAEGSLSVYNFANNIQSFPVGVFGISLAVAAFPSFSKSLSDNNAVEFKKMFSLQTRRILYFLIPVSFCALLLRAQIVRVILGSGSFDWEATRLTAQTLGFFALSLTSQGLIPLFARSFYALEDTMTPVKISVISIILNIMLSIYFAKEFGILGLAVAFSASNIFNMSVLFVVLHHKFKDLDDIILIRSISRILFLSLLAGSIIYLSLQITADIFNTRTFIGILLQGTISGLLGIITYIILSFLFKFDEIYVIRKFLIKLLRPLTNGK